ncbi:MAG: phage DNA encapsidation protein, partial [Lachnospiraceae bacterium]|nr:phage DNA encapsidation protein [Lachnospiraceae bacterium]
MEIPKDGLYLDITDELLHHVNLLFGGRGTGKTFSILKHRLENAISDPDKHKFIWLRDTETITRKLAAKGLTSPIEAKFPDLGHSIIKRIEDNYTFINNPKTENEKFLGYLMALSTFHNARGIDFSDVDTIVFDEFMPEEGTIIRKDQGALWLNMYESINRNRELEGLPPVRVIFLSNTNGLYSEILEDFGLSQIVENMQLNNISHYEDSDIWVEFLENKEFTEAKSKTLLYRLSKNTKF